MSNPITEPLPCPFCGSAVKVEHVQGSYGYTPDYVRIECKTCRTPGTMDGVAFSEPAEGWSPIKGHFSTRIWATETVLARWNRRAS